MKMKILSDFDGVLTDQSEEAALVHRLFLEGLTRYCRLPEAAAKALIRRGEEAIEALPNRHGWDFGGRITAFANEDLFIRQNALGACLDRMADEGDAELIDLRLRLRAADLQDFKALAQLAYTRMTEYTRNGELKPLDPAAVETVKKLLDEGHEVVVVSNSGTDRILDLFHRAGVDAVAHDDAVHGAVLATGDLKSDRKTIRVRGGARKFELGPEPSGFEVSDYFVETARPVYEQIIREERPDAVIGDVFSLDLALPFHLGKTEPGLFSDSKELTLVLRSREYTPLWTRKLFENAENSEAPADASSLKVRLRAVDRFEDVPAALN